jgi:hypothetical protein
MRSGLKLGVITLIVTSFLTTNLHSAKAFTFDFSDFELSNRVISVEKGANSGGKTPYTITVQTKVQNKNLSSVMTYDSLETAAFLDVSTNGNFKTPAQGGTVTASVTPTVSTVTGTDNAAASSARSRFFVFTANSVKTIPANSYVQLQFSFTVEFPIGIAAETVTIQSNVGDGLGSFGAGGGSPNNVQLVDLASYSTLSVLVSPGGGVTASFGTAGLLGYACNDNNSAYTTTCSVLNTYYGKPYITFTAATPDDGYRFDGWGDACLAAGTSTTCTLRVTGDPLISANYSLLPYPTPTSVSTSPEYFEDNTTINGTAMDSADGWAIHYVGSAGNADDLIFKGTSFISQSATSVTVQLPTIAQIETYSATFFGSARNASSGLTWIIYPYADFTSYTTYGGTAPNLVINSATVPDSPDIGSASTVSSTSASVSFTAPSNQGGRTITSYTVSVWNDALDTVLKTQTYSSSLPALGASATFTVTDLTPSTIYKFSVVSTNSIGNSYQSFATAAITTSATSSGGGGTGGGGTTPSTTAADELRRQQEAASAAKQKQDQELKEILSLVPTIAGLAQGIAGLGNSLLLPKKCIKGKLVKNVKAGAKCPKGYKVRK